MFGPELQLSEQRRLILANVFGPKLIGPAVEVAAVVLNRMKVRADS